MRKQLLFVVTLVGVFESGHRSTANAAPDDLAQALRGVSVTRSGELASLGESAPFPKRGAKGVEFGPRVREGKHRLDGSLELARSRSGLELWSLRKWDNGTDDSNLFTLSPNDPAKLPTGAVLQFVDGFWDWVDPELLGTLSWGRRISRHKDKAGDKAMELFLEAWVALPEERVIYRPADKKLYPLVPARGSYAPAAARPVQWMVFHRTCPETGGACVYFGAPRDVCKRIKGDIGDSWIFPYDCP